MSTALRYELAWNYIWEGYSNWKKAIIIDDPDSRQGREFSKDFGREVAKLAESNREIPLVKTNRVVKAKTKIRLQPSGIK